MGADPLHLEPLLNTLSNLAHAGSMESLQLTPILTALQESRVDWPIAFFYIANVIWTLLYEIIYSHQDAAEDAAAGVKNLVLLYTNLEAKIPEQRFGTMPLLVRLAAAQVFFIAAAGTSSGLGLAYILLDIVGTSAALAIMLSRVRLSDPDSCAWWFKVGNAKYAGLTMTVGLMVEYTVRALLQR